MSIENRIELQNQEQFHRMCVCEGLGDRGGVKGWDVRQTAIKLLF